MAPPITEKELHKLVAKLSAAGKRRLLEVFRAELARLAEDGHLRASLLLWDSPSDSSVKA